MEHFADKSERQARYCLLHMALSLGLSSTVCHYISEMFRDEDNLTSEYVLP